MRCAIIRTSAALLACLVAACFLTANPARAGDAAPSPDYDLTVLVIAPDFGPAQVALSYPRLVDHAALKQAIGELAAKTGARIGDLQIVDGRQARGLSDVGTAAQFTAQGLLDPRGGALPLGAVIRSLPEWRRLRLVFLVGEQYAFQGPTRASADGFAVELLTRIPPYEYDVERKSGEAAPSRAAVAERKEVSGALLPAILVGLPAGVLVGWLLSDVKLKR